MQSDRHAEQTECPDGASRGAAIDGDRQAFHRSTITEPCGNYAQQNSASGGGENYLVLKFMGSGA